MGCGGSTQSNSEVLSSPSNAPNNTVESKLKVYTIRQPRTSQPPASHASPLPPESSFSPDGSNLHIALRKENAKQLRKPKAWKHSQPITRTQLLQMRDEFWDTAPHYGGQKEIWDALRAAAEADITFAQAIVDSAGIIVNSVDMTTCYDERGAKYELPKYVLSEPMNLIRDS